jgi:hypothetical protein
MKRLLIAVAAALTLSAPAHALTWEFDYSGTGFSVIGTLTTTNTPDASGFYTITGITGSDNGVAITGLTPAGTAIPLNAGYPVDNLISVAGPQLDSAGFGFSTANGEYGNPFYNQGQYQEFFSIPARNFSVESPIVFQASPVPEPATATLMAMAAGGLAWSRRRRDAR